MKNLNDLIVLGARIGIDKKGILTFSPETEMRAESARIFASIHPATRLIISGGHCVNVCYPRLLASPPFRKPNFSVGAKEEAKRFPSESAMISLWLNNHDIPFVQMILEQNSHTTEEKANNSSLLVADLGDRTAGVLGMAYDLLRPKDGALRICREFFEQFELYEPIPVFTEEILYAADKKWLPVIHEFYHQPRSGFYWPTNEICTRLQAGVSLARVEPSAHL